MKKDYITLKITSDFYGYGGVTVKWKINKDGDCINTFNNRWFCNIVTNECISDMKPEFIEIFKDAYKKLKNGIVRYEIDLR